MNEDPVFTFELADGSVTTMAGYPDAVTWNARSNVQVLERPPEFGSTDDADRWLEEHG